MDYLYALMIAVVLTAALIGIPNLIVGALQRRTFATFARLKCRKCDTPFGRSVVDAGKDTSPWEELWSDGDDHTIHCHPVCRVVTCSNCSADSEIRFQTQGNFFGPRLSVRDPEAHRARFKTAHGG